MKLGIMQPYFFPHLGYFALIKHTDQWIVFDTPQFIRHGWIERNRILKPGEGWQYIMVPLEKHSRDTAIKDIKIKSNNDWREKILAQLEHYKKKAPHYAIVINLIKESIHLKTNSIVELDLNILKAVCNYLNINFTYQVFSTSDIKINNVNAPDEWALNICKKLNARSYYNPTGGISFFDRSKYEKVGIDLKFLQIEATPYYQFSNEFIPNLSIIDVMMFNSPQKIKDMLNNIELIK